MRFIIGEGFEKLLYTFRSWGCIGLFYDGFLGALACYILFGVFCILALIGLYQVLKVIFFGWPTKKKS